MKKIYINLAITLSVVGLMIAAIIYLMQNSLFTVSWFSTNYLNRTMVYQATTLALSLVIVLDYGDVVAHIFTAEARGYYDLEGLWAHAQIVDLSGLVPDAVVDDDAEP